MYKEGRGYKLYSYYRLVDTTYSRGLLDRLIGRP